jgi:hypothetical protein
VKRYARLQLPPVTVRQFAAILAALRTVQCGTNHDCFREMEHWRDIGKPCLTGEEIDSLCHRLSFAIVGAIEAKSKETR